MSASLLTLPPELHQLIIDLLLTPPSDPHPLLPLSTTCTFFRSLLTPYIFTALSFTNTTKSSSSIHLISSRPAAKFVKTLTFTGTAPGDIDSGSTDSDSDTQVSPFRDIEAIFPADLGNVLGNLHLFPNLECLSIGFEFHLDWEHWEDSFYIFQDEESSEQIAEAENTEAWRALMAKTYSSLSRNKHPIKGLEIRDIVAKEVSTFSSPDFHDFLGRVESFKLSIRGDDNGAGWHINTLEGYTEFVDKLDEFFFEHLKAAAEFCLAATDLGPLGQEGHFQAPVPLNDSQMPRLQVVKLEYVFLCRELMDFLVGHAQTLENLVLQNCAGEVRWSENPVYWYEIFEAVVAAKPEKLRKLEILPRTLEFDAERVGEFGDLEDLGEEEYKTLVEETVKANQGHYEERLWAYGTLDDKYGMLFEDDDSVARSFHEGKDQRGYDELMRVVGANREAWENERGGDVVVT
jgi:hypothetical protein